VIKDTKRGREGSGRIVNTDMNSAASATGGVQKQKSVITVKVITPCCKLSNKLSILS
jgi:hypothetical protein